jgi:hypothetical protein
VTSFRKCINFYCLLSSVELNQWMLCSDRSSLRFYINNAYKTVVKNILKSFWPIKATTLMIK